MTIYDTVKNELGNGPAYAKKSDFTSYFGYANGESLGSFTSKQEATDAGAAITETKFDEAGFKAAQDAYRDHQQKIADEWYKRMRAQNPEVNDEVFKLVYDLAWEEGHSAGYGEVENYIDTYVEFATAVTKASA